MSNGSSEVHLSPKTYVPTVAQFITDVHRFEGTASVQISVTYASFPSSWMLTLIRAYFIYRLGYFFFFLLLHIERIKSVSKGFIEQFLYLRQQEMELPADIKEKQKLVLCKMGCLAL